MYRRWFPLELESQSSFGQWDVFPQGWDWVVLCIFKLKSAPYLPVEKHWKNHLVWKGPLEVVSVHWIAAPTAAIAALSREL